MLIQYIQEILTNLTIINGKVSQFLNTYHLPNNVLSVPQIYVESALLILYSFTD
jgi:hypothetical protein